MTFWDINYNNKEKQVLKDVKDALNEGEDPGIEDDWAIGELAEQGYLTTIKLIMKTGKVNYQVKNQYPLTIASLNQRYDVVKYFLSLKPVIKKDDLRPLWGALKEGDIKMVNILLGYPQYKNWLENFPEEFKDPTQLKTLKKLSVGKFADLLR